jgi:parallel beta-helix repeat protein
MQPWNGTPPIPLPDIVYIDDDFNESTPGWCLDHFNNIQEGINTVKTGGIVFVFNGTYSSITIFKSLMLMGENNKTTIIDGGYHSSEVVLISADHVTMSSFTVQHGSGQDSGVGIAIRSDYVTIMDNIITNNSARGIALTDASHTLITRNVITNCPGYGGIQLHGSSTNITIAENCISYNDYGVWICCASGTIFFYHNNFLNNTVQAEDDSSYSDIHYWDDGYPSGGNYWSDYNGSDLYSGPGQNESGSDGIGDTPYHILHYGSPYSHDYYPFIAPDGWISIP